LKTIFDLLKDEQPGNIRTNLLSKINDKLNSLFTSNQKACTLSIITNVFNPISSAMLNVQTMQTLEQALIRYRKDGSNDLYVILSTLGGEINFPELFISKVRGLGFNRINIIVPSIAMSAGTLMTILSDRIIAFSSASIGPIDPQIVVQTQIGPRIVSAIAYKRLIEESLPNLANNNNLGVQGLSALYAAQDLYLYQESLRSLEYVKRVLEIHVKPKLKGDNFKKLLNIFLTEVESHSKPLSLQILKELGFEVIFLDSDSNYKEIADLITEYYSRVQHAFLFEPSRGSKVLLIGTAFGELINEAIPLQIPQVQPKEEPAAKQQKRENKKINIA